MIERLVDSGDKGPAIRTLSGLRAAENVCRRCPLYKDATQAVPGQGPRHAAVMLIGEQPGDQEDRAGRPFVGPAGKLLDRALDDAGLDRGDAFVTNAVKHFKHEMRGKRRLHKRPNAGEIDRCRWWYKLELSIVRPAVIVGLGATAARQVFGRPMPVLKSRGQAFPLDGGGITAFITIHPSALLRVRDDDDRHHQYEAFVADLRRVVAFMNKRAA
jgi:DNA polymerase